MAVISVDTGAWFAAFVSADADHTTARAWLAHNQEPLLTTDYVIDELLTLMRMRGENRRALRVGESLFNQGLAELHFVSPDDIYAAWGVYRQFADKQWSFTDCVSKVVISDRGIQTAFAFDSHFRQFGSVVVVPS